MPSAVWRDARDSRQNVRHRKLKQNATGSICRSKLLAGAVIMTPISNARGICQASVRQRRSTTSAAPISSVNDTYRLPCVSHPSTGTAPQSRANWATDARQSWHQSLIHSVWFCT